MSATPPARPHELREFRVMATDAQLLLRADADAAAAAFDEVETELQRIHDMLTRFEPTSPLNRLSDAGAGIVPPEMYEVLEAADEAWSATGGRFNAGMGGDLMRAGYDRTFDTLVQLTEDDRQTLPGTIATAASDALAGVRAGGSTLPGPPASRRSFTLHPHGLVQVRPGTRLDLGGIAKGWAADRACAMLAPFGSCLVSLGGDLAIHVADGDEPWPIGVPLGDGQTTIALSYGGLATSGQDRRVWRRADGGGTAHHIIDPATGESARSDVLRVTVLADSCAAAEVWTKALLMRGVDLARAEAAQRGLTTVIVGADLAAWFTGDLASMQE